MTWSEALICRALQRQLLGSKCIVAVPNCTWAGSEADVLGVTMNGRLIDIEVKISRADFRADAKKSKWWQSDTYSWVDGRYERRPGAPREWPRRVWKHYYCMPADIFKPELVELAASTRSGILTIRRQDSHSTPYVIRCERRSQPNKDAERLKPEAILDLARLCNLRMWDALASDARGTALAPSDAEDGASHSASCDASLE